MLRREWREELQKNNQELQKKNEANVELMRKQLQGLINKNAKKIEDLDEKVDDVRAHIDQKFVKMEDKFEDRFNKFEDLLKNVVGSRAPNTPYRTDPILPPADESTARNTGRLPSNDRNTALPTTPAPNVYIIQSPQPSHNMML